MNTKMYALILAAVLVIGCRSVDAPSAPSGLPVIYHNAEYDFTFFLPASWGGYSVLLQQWFTVDVPPSMATEQGPEIVLRHPKWKASEPYQDIPIRVFTRRQWGDGDGPPGLDAGGVNEEIAHNAKYVFAVWSRFNHDESRIGWEAANDIVGWNIEVNRPHLQRD